MEIVELKLSQLKPYDKNARKHEEYDISAIMASIETFGFRDPIGVWSEDNIIVEGHGRYEAAKRLKMKTVPCIRLDDMTDEERRAYALAHNKTAELSSWEQEMLSDELDNIFDIDMEKFGFEEDPDEEPTEIIEDEPPEPPAEPKAKLGDVYQLGDHRLICGDCNDISIIERLMSGERADIAFTSPPYNAGTTATEAAMGKKTKYDGNNDDKGEKEYITFINEYLRCALEHSEYVFCNVQSIANNKTALIDILYSNKECYADTIIWDKQNGQPAMAHNVLNSVFEYVHVFSHKANRAIGTIDFRGTIDNILHLPPQRHNDFAQIHNATFSVEFASWFISRFAKKQCLTASAARVQLS